MRTTGIGDLRVSADVTSLLTQKQKKPYARVTSPYPASLPDSSALRNHAVAIAWIDDAVVDRLVTRYRNIASVRSVSKKKRKKKEKNSTTSNVPSIGDRPGRGIS